MRGVAHYWALAGFGCPSKSVNSRAAATNYLFTRDRGLGDEMSRHADGRSLRGGRPRKGAGSPAGAPKCPAVLVVALCGACLGSRLPPKGAASRGGGMTCPILHMVAPFGPLTGYGYPPKAAASRAATMMWPTVLVCGACWPMAEKMSPKRRMIVGLGAELCRHVATKNEQHIMVRCTKAKKQEVARAFIKRTPPNVVMKRAASTAQRCIKFWSLGCL